MKPFIGYVYLVTNSINGKCYVGQTIGTVSARWKKHISSANRGSNLAIHCAIRKYGESSFSIKTIWTSDVQQELNSLETIEIYLRNTYLEGYNSTIGGDKSTAGLICSEETKTKLRQAATGNQKCLGFHHSDTAKANMSKSKIGNKNSVGNKNTLGYKQSKDQILNHALAISKPFAMISPSGIRHEGINLNSLCLEFNINHSNMYQVNLGKRKSCKGWTKAPTSC